MLSKVIPDYVNRISNPLFRIYGVYKIKLGHKNSFSIMIMGNFIPSKVDIVAKFDLKGSKVDRATSLQSPVRFIRNLSLQRLRFCAGIGQYKYLGIRKSIKNA